MSEVHADTAAEATNGIEQTEKVDAATQKLASYLEGARQHIDEETRVFFESLLSEFWEPYQKKWATAKQVHNDAILKFTDILDPESPLTWKQTVDYRRTVHLRIFLKVPAALTPSPYAQIDSLFKRYLNRLKRITSSCPEVLEVPENPAVFSNHPSDTLPVSIRKWIRRRRQGLRFFGHTSRNIFRRITFRKPIELRKKTQVIPLRHLVGYHISTRVPEQIVPFLNTIHALITNHLAVFEKAQTEWLHSLLENEHRLYSPRNVLNANDTWLTEESDTLTTGINGQDVGLAVRKLEDALHFNAAKWEEALTSCRERILATFDALNYDTRRGGTFLLSLSERPVSEYFTIKAIDEVWREWHEEVFQRVQLCNETLKLHGSLLSSNQNQIKNIHTLSIAPILSSYTALNTHIEATQIKASELCARAKESGDLKMLETELHALQAQLVNQFRVVLEDVNAIVRSGEALEQTVDSSRMELTYYVDRLARVYHVHSPLTAAPPVGRIPSSRYSILLQNLVRKSLSATSRTGSLSASALELKKAVFKTWGDTQEVQNIIEFNLTAAVDELNDTPDENDSEQELEEANTEQSEKNALTNAEKLIDEALTRSREKLSELKSHLETPWQTFIKECFKATNSNWKTIQQDLRYQDQIHNWFENARILIGRFFSNTTHAISDFRILAGNQFRKFVKKTRATSKKLIEKGQVAVGVVEQSEEEWLQTLKRVSNLSSLHESLPLIYQKLFSPNPLHEQDLLEGRQKDLDFIANHFEKWKKGQVGPLVLSMIEGSGRTSLTNVLHHSVFNEAMVHRVGLEKRVTSTENWANQVAYALGIKDQTGPAMPLEALESVLISRTKSNKPDVILIDQFEHLLLCTPGGDKILERILIFMSRTDHAIYWVANVNKHAWHYLEKTIHPSFGFITAYSARMIGRSGIEEILLKRHHRSGLALRFEPEIASRSLLRFYRPRDEKNKQRDLQRAFFDRLYRLSGENIRLAILYWLRAVRFNQENDVLHVKAIEPINFAFLDTLDQIRAFTLKSFMVHGTLTLKEHMELYKKKKTESIFILESLLNLSIIDPVGQKGVGQQQIHIIEDVPYRLHSLIRHPVTEYLTREHIIY